MALCISKNDLIADIINTLNKLDNVIPPSEFLTPPEVITVITVIDNTGLPDVPVPEDLDPLIIPIDVIIDEILDPNITTPTTLTPAEVMDKLTEPGIFSGACDINSIDDLLNINNQATIVTNQVDKLIDVAVQGGLISKCEPFQDMIDALYETNGPSILSNVQSDLLKEAITFANDEENENLFATKDVLTLPPKMTSGVGTLVTNSAKMVDNMVGMQGLIPPVAELGDKLKQKALGVTPVEQIGIAGLVSPNGEIQEHIPAVRDENDIISPGLEPVNKCPPDPDSNSDGTPTTVPSGFIEEYV